MAMTFTKTIDKGLPFETHDSHEVTVTLPHWDLNITEVGEAFTSFLLACGFHPESIKSIMASEE